MEIGSDQLKGQIQIIMVKFFLPLLPREPKITFNYPQIQNVKIPLQFLLDVA